VILIDGRMSMQLMSDRAVLNERTEEIPMRLIFPPERVE